MGWKTQPVSGWGLFVVLTLVGPVFGVDNVLETSINIAREATCDYIHAKFPGCQSSNTKSSKTAECDYIHAQFQGCQPSDGADGKIRMKRKLAERVDESNQDPTRRDAKGKSSVIKASSKAQRKLKKKMKSPISKIVASKAAPLNVPKSKGHATGKSSEIKAPSKAQRGKMKPPPSKIVASKAAPLNVPPSATLTIPSNPIKVVEACSRPERGNIQHHAAVGCANFAWPNGEQAEHSLIPDTKATIKTVAGSPGETEQSVDGVRAGARFRTQGYVSGNMLLTRFKSDLVQLTLFDDTGKLRQVNPYTGQTLTKADYQTMLQKTMRENATLEDYAWSGVIFNEAVHITVIAKQDTQQNCRQGDDYCRNKGAYTYQLLHHSIPIQQLHEAASVQVSLHNAQTFSLKGLQERSGSHSYKDDYRTKQTVYQYSIGATISIVLHGTVWSIVTIVPGGGRGVKPSEKQEKTIPSVIGECGCPCFHNHHGMKIEQTSFHIFKTPAKQNSTSEVQVEPLIIETLPSELDSGQTTVQSEDLELGDLGKSSGNSQKNDVKNKITGVITAMLADTVGNGTVKIYAVDGCGLVLMGTLQPDAKKISFVVLAGQNKPAGFEATGISMEGTGTSATFNFNNKLASRYSGASLGVYRDPISQKKFLTLAEGAQAKLRTIDLSTPMQAVSDTVTNIVGPRDLAIDSKASKAYVLDMNGNLLQVNMALAIPCGQIFNFTGDALNAWKIQTQTCARNSGEASNEFSLRRQGGQSCDTWSLKVMKKTATINLKGKDWFATKDIVCSTPKGTGLAMSCCVRKSTKPATDDAEVNRELSEYLTQF